MGVIVIAELGVNWQGDPEMALRMVDAAADAGCDAVKVQVFDAEEFCTPAAMIGGERQVDFFRRFEMGSDTIQRVCWRCRDRGLLFVGTATSQRALESLSMAHFIKIGSDDLTNVRLLEAARKVPQRTILSTGMATEREITAAVAISRPDYLLHCVSLYPCPIESANLRRIDALVDIIGGFEVGYSDHTEGHESALAAIALGAEMIEKHFTLDRTLPGPDHAFSETLSTMAQLVRSIRRVEASLGDGLIDPQPDEWRMRKVARRQVTATRGLVAGTKLDAGMLWPKRTGGVGDYDAGELDSLVGRTLSRDVGPDHPLTQEDLNA
jgi:N,N'-diacetyllegionaminate synthase